MGFSPTISENSLDFVLFLTSYQVREWIPIVGTMSISFDVGSKKSSVENIIDAPLEREFELECETS